jgi:hypothetical protein|tara:strand:- start:1296 stop:1511 length:216 start_codon:yes stop_codon:yes gene_type:complete
MVLERRVVLYEGTNLDETEEAKRILSEKGIKFDLISRDSSGDSDRFQNLPLPVFSEGRTDYYGAETIRRLL